MRRETPESQQHHSSSYGAGTRVEVHRSRHELEHVLHKYGADEVLFVEADANAAIQFAMHGRYVQLALPLPDPRDPRFTHTLSGKPRAATAQERAYDQALREHWRSLIVAVRGKLQSVESGISTFEQEFDRFLVPHLDECKKKRHRKTPKAVNWLLGGSHSVAIALVAAFLVPASAVGAFALPTNVVGHLAAPFRSAVAESASAGQGGNGLALARGGWTPSSANSSGRSSDPGRLLALRSELLGDTGGQVRREASLSSPPAAVVDPPASPQVDLASNNTSSLSNGETSAPPSPPAGGGGGGGQQPAHNGPPPTDDPPAPVVPPEQSDGSSSTDTQSTDTGDPGDQQTPPSDDPSAGDASDTAPAGDAASTDAPPSTGADTAPGNGNANGNGNGNGNGNANGQNGTQGQGQGNGNGNGNANGQNGTQGQGNGQASGQGQGNSQGQGNGNGQGNGKVKGGK
jgi:hypothetical protein